MRTHRATLKLQFLVVDTRTQILTQIGYIVLDLRGSPSFPPPERWVPLAGVAGSSSRQVWGKPEVKVAFGVGVLEDLENLEAMTVTEAASKLPGVSKPTPIPHAWWENTPKPPKPKLQRHLHSEDSPLPLPPLPAQQPNSRLPRATSSPAKTKGLQYQRGISRPPSPAKAVAEPPFTVLATLDGCYQIIPPSTDSASTVPMSEFSLKLAIVSARNLVYLVDPSKPNAYAISFDILGTTVRTDQFPIRHAGPRAFVEADSIAAFPPEVAKIKLRAAPIVLRKWLREGLGVLRVSLVRIGRAEGPEVVAVSDIVVGAELAARLDSDLAAKASFKASYAFSQPDGSEPEAPEDTKPSVEISADIEHRPSTRFFDFLDGLEAPQPIEQRESRSVSPNFNLANPGPLPPPIQTSPPKSRSKAPSPEEPQHRFRVSVDLRAVRDLKANQTVYLRYQYPPLGTPAPFTVHPAISTGPAAGAEIAVPEGGFDAYDVDMQPVRLETYLSGMPLIVELWSRDPEGRNKDVMLGAAKIVLARFIAGMEGSVAPVKRAVGGREVVCKVWDTWHRIEEAGRKRGEVRVLIAVEDFGRSDDQPPRSAATASQKQMLTETKETVRAASPERKPAEHNEIVVSEGVAKHLQRKHKLSKLEKPTAQLTLFDEMTSTETLTPPSEALPPLSTVPAATNTMVLATQLDLVRKADTKAILEWETDLILRLEAESREREAERERAYQKRMQQLAEREDKCNSLYKQLIERERAVQRAEDEAQRILVDLEREKERQEKEWDDRCRRWDETRAHHANLERARLEMAEERIRRAEKDREEAEETRRRSEREMQRLQNRVLEQQHQLLQLQQVGVGKDSQVDAKAIVAAAASAASSSAEVTYLTGEVNRMEVKCQDLDRRLVREKQAAAHYKEKYRLALRKLGEYKHRYRNSSVEFGMEGYVSNSRMELEEIRRELDHLRRSVVFDDSERDTRPVTRANTETRSRGLDGGSLRGEDWDDLLRVGEAFGEAGQTEEIGSQELPEHQPVDWSNLADETAPIELVEA